MKERPLSYIFAYTIFENAFIVFSFSVTVSFRFEIRFQFPASMLSARRRSSGVVTLKLS